MVNAIGTRSLFHSAAAVVDVGVSFRSKSGGNDQYLPADPVAVASPYTGPIHAVLR